MNLEITIDIIKKTISVFFIVLSILYLDNSASKYGNGIFKKYYNLKYNTSITKISDTYITYNDLEFGMGYIMPNERFNDKIFVTSLLGYSVENICLKIFVQSNNQIIQLSFVNKAEIVNKNPDTKIMSGLPIDAVNLSAVPFYIYYWKPIFGILVLLIFGIAGDILKSVILR
ncbi:hypothetical protein MWN41_09530 [Ornithobacterium rhinotracheale]|uniref:hypothetical protein n=1 Tax=Ornithobacterium rhinotracheale TaxID=28251 RepID=UPI001FF1FB37|nr:hypothetical protein [Ornithobacterium rhinotracheale]MCK0203252.1 hypothetical protein [Ornithobacterium rhinotracheale]